VPPAAITPVAKDYRGVADDLQGRSAAAQIGEAADPDEAHRHADGNPQQHQHEQKHESGDRNGVAVVP
jgi:hypothetical protein